jgi:putative FmdB family regulatory protein
LPVYQYACTECGEQLEARQSFSDDPLTVCPACAGRLRKVLSAVGVVFKGSGFYRTDSRAPADGSAKDGADTTSAGDGSGSSSEKTSTSGPSSEKTPAASGSATPPSGGSSAAKAAS